MIVNIAKCPSCGQRHEGLEFAPIPYNTSWKDKRWTHQCLCPTNQLFYVRIHQDKVMDSWTREGEVVSV